MVYQKVVSGRFIERPNRFIAKVNVGGTTETVHVKNTGRCKELLVPGATVWLEDFDGRMGNRKLRYSLIAVEKVVDMHRALLINMDSQAPNAVIKECFERSGVSFRPEVTFGKSRFDFYFEKDGKAGFLEVKGCTLESDGHCRFPDAPTERGVKHLEELISARAAGYWAGVLILVQMAGMTDFAPNDDTDPAFGSALRRAAAAGVEVLCYGCHVTPDSLELSEPVPVML